MLHLHLTECKDRQLWVEIISGSCKNVVSSNLTHVQRGKDEIDGKRDQHKHYRK